jgi:hypothetical protein
MMFSTVMAKGVVAEIVRGCRATTMLDGESAGDCLTCTEDQCQNRSESNCLATHLTNGAPVGGWDSVLCSKPSIMWWAAQSRANINLVIAGGALGESQKLESASRYTQDRGRLRPLLPMF